MIKQKTTKKNFISYSAAFFWFFFGFCLTGFLIISFVLFYFQLRYQQSIYPGVFIDKIYVGEKTPAQAKAILEKSNAAVEDIQFIFVYKDNVATVSARELGVSYNTDLLIKQAFSLGRTRDIFTNFYLIFNSYINGTYLVESYNYSNDILKTHLKDITALINTPAIDALFTVENNRVVAFRESADGRSIDFEKLDKTLHAMIPELLSQKEQVKREKITLSVPIKVLKPTTTTDEANNFGIVELIGIGTSEYAHSIPNRVYNVALATSRINGALVAPGEDFSFNKTLGDVSKFTGYKEAYVITNGKTVLGDGGGVCQVSTTLFRAALNAGLPITERHAHAYRVGYYEQDSPPGIDATIYTPTVDLKFKNDTDSYIFIQGIADSENTSLTFYIYGKKDGREVEITKPVISGQSAPPPALYTDDPTLQKGIVKQVEYEAFGARTSFNRTVTKNGEVLYKDTFVSNYRPWQAVFLRGTKE